jgi:hypothetical protein
VKALLFCLALAAFCFAEEAKTFPASITITSGYTYQNTALDHYDREFVIVIYHGQKTPIRYLAIAEPQRTQILALRDAAQKTPSRPTSAPTGLATEIVMDGEVFIVTRGAGNYALGDLSVYAFPMSVWDGGGTGTWRLGKPLASAQTGSDGKFRIKLLEPGDFFIFAQGQRMAGRNTEYYTWEIKGEDIADRSRVVLSNSNQVIDRHSSFEIN